MKNLKPIIVGAVLYDPKVSIIWDIIREFFETSGCPMDVVFFTNYELQVKTLLEGHLDLVWNSPLAWLDAQRQSGGFCRAVAMRDTDRDRTSHFVVGPDRGVGNLSELRGKTVAVGAKDSPQATLIPIGFLQRNGLEPGRDFTVRRLDLLVGKHGDHIGGEWDAFQCLAKGEAAACAMLDLNWQAWTKAGRIDSQHFAILATTDPFDHCVFTVRPGFPADDEQRWLRVLFAMDYQNPKHREMMDFEGLKKWLPGRTTGFGPLSEAVQRQGFFAGG
jgi:ABC-type phosphate/phosphonate transport system substrate-binding protein